MPASKTKRAGTRAAATRLPTLARRIITGSDGTEESMGALRLAAALQRENRARVHAMTVVEPIPAAAIPSLDLQPPAGLDETRRRVALQQLRAQCRAARPQRPWSYSSVIGWPMESIVDAAKRRKADLIVVGIGKHRPIDRLLAHETAISIVRHATVPVLAVAPLARKVPRHALVALDFSDSSIEAARAAAALVGPKGTVTLAHVSPFHPSARRDGIAWTEIYDAGASDHLKTLEQSLAAAGVRVDAVILRGYTPEELLRFARKRRVDLIAVGGHKQSLLDRMVVGSTTTRVLRGASSSVLVVPEHQRRRRR